MFYLNLDGDGYLLSVSKMNTGGPAVNTLDGYDLSGCRISAHRWDGATLNLDEERLAELEAAEQPGDETETPAELEARVGTLEEELQAAKILLGVE